MADRATREQLVEKREGFVPCPFCKQYSHSIGEGQLVEAFRHFQSMIAHPVRGHPMGYAFDEKTRDAAQVLMAAAQSLSPPNEGMQPIPMLLYCPQCGQQHIDEPDERTPDWDNPPHRSHLCHDCGCIWRPADLPTNGVAAIETQGKADTWTPERGNAECAALSRTGEAGK